MKNRLGIDSAGPCASEQFSDRGYFIRLGVERAEERRGSAEETRRTPRFLPSLPALFGALHAAFRTKPV
jgi:hypothetical protein